MSESGRSGVAVASDLGNQLFEIRASRDEVAVRVVLSLLALGVLTLLLRWPGTVAGALAYLAASAVAGLLVWSTTRRRLAVFEHGVSARTEFGERALRYDDAEHLGFAKVARTAQGVPAGTTLALDIRGRSGLRVAYGTTLGADGHRFDEVRDRIAAVIGTRISRRIHEQGRSDWVPRRRWAGFPGFSLSREGLIVERSRPLLIPYEGMRLRWSEGWLEILEGDARKPAARLSSAWRDFYPGYLVLLLTLEGRTTS